MTVMMRCMTEKDWPNVRCIYEQGISSGIATFQTEVPSYEVWNAAHLTTGRLVAVVDEEVVGWVALSPTSSRCVYKGVAELSIYIVQNAQRKGVATKLLNELIQLSEQEGIWTLQSIIIEENKASLALHQKCGFRQVGYREKIARDQKGDWHNTILMERRSQVDNF